MLDFLRDIKKNKFSYLLILPAIIYTAIYGYYTWPWLIIAFQRFSPIKGILGSDFVGLCNFQFFFNSSNSWIVTRNTFYLNFLYLVVQTVTCVTVAILINEVCGAFKKTIKLSQSFMLLPNFLSWVVISYIVYSLFTTQFGYVNAMLQSLGFDKISWYNNPKYWPIILTLTKVWKTAGVDIIIYLAVITGFDNQIYEAAAIDGATRLQKIRYVLVPMLIPTICILTLLSVGRIFYGDFGMIYTIIKDNGVLYPTTDVIDTYVFRALRINGDISQATAVGMYQSLMGLILVSTVNAITRRVYPDGALF